MSRQLLASLAVAFTSASLVWAQSAPEANHQPAPVAGIAAASDQPDQPEFLTQADNPEKVAAPAAAAPVSDVSEAPVVGTDMPAAPVGSGRLYAGSAATFLKPRFSGLAGGSLSSAEVPNSFFGLVGIPAPATGGGVADFHHEADWRGWLGFETQSGLGVRARYSQYRSSSDTLEANSAADFAIIGQLFSITAQQTGLASLDTSLRMRVLDLDATYEFTAGNWSILGAVGARWADLRRQARLSQDTTLSGSGSFIIFGFSFAGENQSFTDSTQDFQHWGPTIALELRRNWSAGRLAGAFFTNLRGSSLAGDTHLNQTSATATSFSINTLPFIQTSSNSSTVFSRPVTTTIGELEIGGEVGFVTRAGEFFLRAGYEWQRWNEGGSAIGTSAHGDALYLSGFNVGAGWRF